MITGIGTDIVEIIRIKNAIKKRNFLSKIFTDNEIEYFRGKNMKPETIAGYFTVKESVSKALGCGFRKIKFKDIEIIKDSYGKPGVQLYNNAKKIADENKIIQIHVSISHSDDYAVSTVILES
jgi:holo-[acyl-carrier protein] synthase